ncbi:tyrosyl-DNA phosphodiesterase I [Clohesyomyces aquaticus]|uniref:Tyrosyl-DNA phosphodiesterase I n=1 Tax=Clohesyomyces aquaticus TaxID=1231657 RepID=A0A1Y1ZH39_9PLEO|nr:tyrosyl-DNA phosphodiesterase I [Clohesyomyces aquaticus]
MTRLEPDGSPAAKRRKLDSQTDSTSDPASSSLAGEKATSRLLDRPISPPLSRRVRSATPTPSVSRARHGAATPPVGTAVTKDNSNLLTCITSPIQLTKIADLAPAQNVDTIGLDDILGHPMIKECWNFNFLFDLDFVMKHFDPDVRALVKVKIVHGFWKREDETRISLQENAERFPNIELISAYIPDPFGTHHSKMMILLRHDDFAQVVIHTANMISRDWGNMTQAVWRSPLLPLLPQTSSLPSASPAEKEAHAIGSGMRFKKDLLGYLQKYGKRLGDLPSELSKYDFSKVRAAFIGSAPSRQKPNATPRDNQTSWGWLGLGEILSSIPVSDAEVATSPPNIFIQISSIATLGQNPTWLQNFQAILGRTASGAISSPSDSRSPSGFFTKRTPPTFNPKAKRPTPKFNIIFPTASEIRASLDGYNSGGSIHTKLQSTTQQKQLQYLHPMLCHWTAQDETLNSQRRKAERGPAAPHIKTYIRFRDSRQKSIDWAMVTSANLSKQAWGELENKNGEVWIQSWECGVVVWPDLFKPSDDREMDMVPVFGNDMPEQKAEHEGTGLEDSDQKASKGDVEDSRKTLVGFRMPYDLPLSPYKKDEVPWCATLPDSEPDWRGAVWRGYQPRC